MTKPAAIVINGDGINCEAETIFALNLAGFVAKPMHVTDLMERSGAALTDCQLLVLPGGFAYGDEIASGKVLAVKLNQRLQDTLHSYIARGSMLLGICNGFQVLVQLGLLPDSQAGGKRMVSLLHNSQKRFLNKWVKLDISPSTRSRFFKNLSTIDLPIRHGEGRIALQADEDNSAPRTAEIVKQRAPLRYCDNINGSFDRIAALENEAGNVLGLMPHPEAFVRWTQFPGWTSKKLADAVPHGLAILQNAALSLN